MRPNDFFALAILSAKENLGQPVVYNSETPAVKSIIKFRKSPYHISFPTESSSGNTSPQLFSGVILAIISRSDSFFFFLIALSINQLWL